MATTNLLFIIIFWSF